MIYVIQNIFYRCMIILTLKDHKGNVNKKLYNYVHMIYIVIKH